MDLDPNDPKKTIPALATATDLGSFGSRAWMQGALTDFENHFANFKNAKWYGEDDTIDVDDSEMTDWSGDRAALTSDANKENLESIIEFLVSETGRADLELDDDLVAKGKDLAGEANWAGDIGMTCVDCHTEIGNDFDPEYEGGDYPYIAKYASAAWLKDFLLDPGSPKHYGTKNRMPAYGKVLTPEELNLLTSWLVGDYYPTKVHDYEPISDATDDDAASDDATESPAEELSLIHI